MAISEATRVFQGEIAVGIASRFIDRMALYARDGRPHGRLDDAALEGQWVAAVRAMAANVRCAAARERQHDLEAEYRLRRQAPPYHLVQGEIALYARRTEEMLVEMVRNDPETVETLSRALEQEIALRRAARPARA